MIELLGDLITNLDLLVFVIVGFLVLLSSFLMLEAKNLTHAIIFLALAFAGVAVMYLLMAAEFLAMIQMTVYTGGVIVLFLFALMLTRSEEFNLRSEINSKVSALIAILLVSVFILIVIPITDLYVSGINPFNEVSEARDSGFPHGIAWVGFSLFNYYQVSFIVLGFIVVAALVGTIYIVKNEPGEDIRVVSPAAAKNQEETE